MLSLLIFKKLITKYDYYESNSIIYSLLEKICKSYFCTIYFSTVFLSIRTVAAKDSKRENILTMHMYVAAIRDCAIYVIFLVEAADGRHVARSSKDTSLPSTSRNS